MSMTPTRLRECIALPDWSLRKLAQVLNVRPDACLQIGQGKRPISPELTRWLEKMAAVWEPLSPELREIARQMECDAGKFVRHPRDVRPITDDEAEQLQDVAWFHERQPAPGGWRDTVL